MLLAILAGIAGAIVAGSILVIAILTINHLLEMMDKFKQETGKNPMAATIEKNLQDGNFETYNIGLFDEDGVKHTVDAKIEQLSEELQGSDLITVYNN
ncbi:hypothetical protein [Desulfurobacterium sp.]